VITGSPVPLFVQASNAHAATARHQFRMAGSWALAHPPATPPDGGAVWPAKGPTPRRAAAGMKLHRLSLEPANPHRARMPSRT